MKICEMSGLRCVLSGTSTWLVALVAVEAAILGCTTNPPGPLIIETGPRAEVTPDGLHRASNSIYQDVWVKPDVDFVQYTKGILEPVEIAYKRDPRGRTRNSPSQNYSLTKEQTRWISRMMHEAFSKELESVSGFEIVTEPGPNVLRIYTEIVDLVVSIPTRPSGGRDYTFTASAGQMTLLLELRDAETREILARAADRREARSSAAAGHRLYYSNAATNTDAVRRIFARWAQILRARLAALHPLTPSDSAEPDA